MNVVDRILDDLVTIGAIGSLTYIAHLGGLSGEATLLLITAITGLGGYRIKKGNGS